MDITTLPQEMLANMLKYHNFDALLQLRKLNSCVNSVVKGYGMMPRIPVARMEISYCDYEAGEANQEFCIEFELDSNLSDCGISMKYRYEYPLSRRNLLEKLAYWSKKVTVTGELALNDCLRIDESLLSVLNNHRKAYKHCKSIFFSDLPVDLSIDKNTELLNIFPELENIDLRMYELVCPTLINKEVLGNRKWSSMNLSQILHAFNPDINDNFLLEVAANCESFSLFSPIDSFTLEGVVNVIKNLVAQGRGSVELPGVQLGDIPYEATESVIRSIEGVTSVEKTEERYTVQFQVQLSPQTRQYIMFSVDDPNRPFDIELDDMELDDMELDDMELDDMELD